MQKDLNAAQNFQQDNIFKVNIWTKFMGKEFGQFGKNSPKSGQSLEKVSQPRGLRFHSNKYDFLKLE